MISMYDHPALREVHLSNFEDSEGDWTQQMCRVLRALPALRRLVLDYPRALNPQAAELRKEARGQMLMLFTQVNLDAFSYRAACYPNQMLPAIGAADMAATLRRLELTRCVMPADEALAGRVLLGLPLFPALEELRLEFMPLGCPGQPQAGRGAAAGDGGATAAALVPGRVTDALLRALLAPLAAHRPAPLARLTVSLPAAALRDCADGALSWGCCCELLGRLAGLSIEFIED
jgi:hypothetical protein